MKPYRLINQSELKALNKHCVLILEDWNKSYSLHPWTASLSLPSKNIMQPCLTISNTLDFAIIEDHYLDVFNYVLFGEKDFAFNKASKYLAFLLFKALFKTENINIQEGIFPNWQYQGSTCLLLTLKSGGFSLNLLLNPHWVYEQLPKLKTNSNTFPLEEALENTKLDLNLELNCVELPINQLANLQVGDVIALDHPLNTPLLLKQKKELIALGELGLNHHHKSIVLRKSS